MKRYLTLGLLAGLQAATLAAGLADLATPEAATRALIGSPAPCKAGFVATLAPQAERPLPLPAEGGVTFSAADHRRWKARLGADNDVADWARIRRQADAFVERGEDPVVDSDQQRGSHGMKARDAAFVALVLGESKVADAVADYLLAAAAEPRNDFGSLCFRQADNSAPFDAYYEQAAWLLRYLVTYDYVRGAVPDAQRLRVENYVRRQSYFLAAHLDWNLALAFPNRLRGDYAVRRLDAAAPRSPADAYASKRYDTNGDCKVDAQDDPASHPVHAYAAAGGEPGPRLSRISLWFNNRKSAAAVAFGTAGLLLGDGVLVNRAKRYVMEWLAFSVWPDGSEGEYFRNGDYCVPRQGVIYAQYNVQAAVLLAHWLGRAGDDSLLRFATTEGLFGSQSAGGPAKSIAAVVRSELRLLSGQVERFYFEGWKTAQEPRPETSLGRVESRYMNAGRTITNQHALGLLLAEDSFPDLPLAGVLRPAASAALQRQRGGQRVATGYGQWQDVFGALPAVLLLR